MKDEEEWERPVGLTKEHAIYVHSSSDEEGNETTSCNDKSTNNDELRQRGDNTTKACSISSFFKNKSASEQVVVASESCTQTDSTNDPKKSAINSLSDTNNVTRNEPEPPLHEMSVNTDNENHTSSNPFAEFAFNTNEPPPPISKSWQSKKRTLQIPTSTSVKARSQKKIKQVKDNKKTLQSQSTKTDGSEQLLQSEEHRQELIKKWHSFSDATAPIEERRFQVLIAARIHARCQEPIVHKAMQRLREYFAKREQTIDGTSQSLSAQCLSQCDPENDIAPLLSSVLFGNVKAQHIVQAAQDVLSKFRGQVPESMCSLQDITGIGPKLSQILNIVNKRDTYKGEGTSG